VNPDLNHPSYLLLASASPRRSELLERMGLRFEKRPADVTECESVANGPEEMVLKNARLKADALASEYSHALTLGSDTTVAFEDVALGKPSDYQAARRMLQQLSGRDHIVYTAVALRWPEGNYCHGFVESSRVRFKALDETTIDRYFKVVNPLDKAGAYGIQAGRDLIIESVDGSVESVMGLPIQTLATVLAAKGFDFAK
jgi:septum formation protein